MVIHPLLIGPVIDYFLFMTQVRMALLSSPEAECSAREHPGVNASLFALLQGADPHGEPRHHLVQSQPTPHSFEAI